MRVLRSRLVEDGGYPAIWLVSVVLGVAATYLWPAVRLWGLTLATVIGAVGVALTFAAWIGYRPGARWGRTAFAFLALWLIAWALAVWASVRHDEVVDPSLAFPPLVVALIAAKRPSGPAVTRAVDAFAWTTAALFFGVLLAQQVHLLDPVLAGTALPGEERRYWLPLADPLGIDGRWLGPFRTPNVSASAAVFLIVWGAVRPRVTRVVLIATGVLVLLLTGTRSSLFAAVVGVAVILVLTPGHGMVRRLVRWGIVGVATLGALLGGVYALRRNPSLSGRTDIWPVFLDLWRTDPVGGVGDSGVGLAVEAGRLPDWATHAHSLLLDPLARNGIVAAGAIIAALVVAVVIGVQGAVRGRPAAIALVSALIVGGLTETLLDWRYSGYQMAVLISAVLVGAAYLRAPGQARATLTGPRWWGTPTPSDLRRADACVALDAAQAGAQIVHARFRSALTITEKPGEDFATDVDVAAERAIRDVLEQERPADAIVGEELGGQVGGAGRRWLVDPLCGTTNFASGLPFVATNVALLVDGDLSVAACVDPLNRDAYWTDGTSAQRWSARDRIDRPLVPDATHGKVALDGTMDAARLAGLLGDPTFASVFRPIMVATSLATVWVADGRLAAYVTAGASCTSVHFAAGIAIARAAGCIVTDWQASPLGVDPSGIVVAADAATHAAVVAALRRPVVHT